MIFLDFETRSRCDLPSRGVYKLKDNQNENINRH